MEKSWALVFGGGGGKGAYQIGAWKGLKEYGVDKKITAVAGTSVGALNTALFVQGDLELACKVWGLVDNSSILVPDKAKYLEPLKRFELKRIITDGVFSNQGLLSMLETHVDFAKISRSQLIAFATCSKMPELKFMKMLKRQLEPTYFRLNGQKPEKIRSILLASSAIPFIFDPVEIDGSPYVDGGTADNVPIRPLYDLGYRHFIVVNLDMYHRLPRNQFRDADIIEVMPAHTWTENIFGILDFSPASIQAQIETGYNDTTLTLSSRFSRPDKPNYFKKLLQLLPGKKTFKSSRGSN